MPATAKKFAPWVSARRRRPPDIGTHIGARIRERRIMLGLTAVQLAELIGVRPEQARRYEKGLTTISAERLYFAAQALGVDTSFFFEGLHEERFSATPKQRMLLEFARNFIAIEDEHRQEELCALARAYAEHDAPVDEEPESGHTSRIAAPVKFMAKLMEAWRIDERQAAKLLGFDEEEDVRSLLSGVTQPDTRDCKDRLRHLIRIREALHAVFRDLQAEREWLHEPRPELGGRKPFTLLLEGSMENLLTVSQLVQWMVGR
jgi:transcriptional regulator with XRE-family HTH domain